MGKFTKNNLANLGYRILNNHSNNKTKRYEFEKKSLSFRFQSQSNIKF